jgi:hypothetical protein
MKKCVDDLSPGPEEWGVKAAAWRPLVPEGGFPLTTFLPADLASKKGPI